MTFSDAFFLGALRVKYFYWPKISPRLYFGEHSYKVRGLSASRNMGRIQTICLAIKLYLCTRPSGCGCSPFLDSDSYVVSSLYFNAPIT